MLIPAFLIYLQERVQRGKATIGKFDGQFCSLACATLAGKVFIHSPHEQQPGIKQVAYLNINKQVTSLVSGALQPNSSKEYLFIGAPTSLQCYDIELNRDVFFKEVSDGVSCITVGWFGNYTRPLVIVGGNCSVQGFDIDGKEVFWAVTGDNVSSISLADIDRDGKNELLVGSDDCDIRVFKEEEVLMEIPEADKVVGLVHVEGSRFAYALENGTIGVYEGAHRLWRVKSKHSVAAVTAFDLNADGVPELITGWSNGKVEARSVQTGEVLYRDTLGSPVAAVMAADLRGKGALELVAAGVDGELRGYQVQDDEMVVETGDVSAQQHMVQDLVQKKQELIHELASYRPRSGSAGGASPAGAAALVESVVPVGTRVDSCISLNRNTTTCELTLSTNSDAVIKAAIVFGELIFQGESLLVVPPSPSTSLTMSLNPSKDAPVMLMIKALVGSKASGVYQVFELEMELPKYAMYAVMERPPQLPAGYVTFNLNHPLQRLAAWIEQRFSAKATVARPDALEAHFSSYRDKQALGIKAGPAGSGVHVWLHTDSMELAGELVQDLAGYVGVEQLASTCNFPALLRGFQETLDKVEAHAATRSALVADTADSTVQLKQLLVRAEDARILGNMAAMKRAYRRLYDINRDMLAEHDKRARNHAELLEGLKSINKMIQQAGRLRVGGPQTKAVAACRAAVKASNMQALLKVIRGGAGDGPCP